MRIFRLQTGMFWRSVSSYDPAIEPAVLPYKAPAAYNGKSTNIKFGALLGWIARRDIEEELERVLSGLDEAYLAKLGILDLEHQTGGHSCWVAFLLAKPIRIRGDMLDFAERLCGRFYHGGGGWFFPRRDNSHLTDEFDKWTADAGLVAYDHRSPGKQEVMEAIYPFSGAEANLRVLVADYEDIASEMRPLLSSSLLRSELVLALIAENSD